MAKTTREKQFFLNQIEIFGSFFSQGPQTIKYELIDMRKNWSINTFYCRKNLTKKYCELNLKLFDNRLKSCFCQKTEADIFGVFLWHLELKLVKKG